MAKVVPFRGIRYDPNKAPLDDVTSPPYDVISASENEALHDRHPKNMVRLILGRELPADNEQENRYTRSARHLDEWLADGILRRDEKPAFYAYEQHYTLRGQPKTIRGLVALVKIQDYAERIILPHEKTLAKPKSHLVPLIRATNANLDSVYALYPDREHAVDAVLDRTALNPPTGEAVDRDGVTHKMWRIDDPNDIRTMQQTLADKQLVIADGHHRYETSLGYRDEMRSHNSNPQGEQSYDYVMMTLVNVYAPDVIVLPTHRMVRNLPQDVLDDLDARLSDLFELVPSSREKILCDMTGYCGRAIGIYRPGRAYMAAAKECAAGLVLGSPAAQGLDLNILHQLILDRRLGIDSERLRQEANVVYTRDEDEAIRRTDAGEFQLSFLLNPIRLETILSVAQAGETMPQKATYFYPKLLSGMVMRRIEW